MPPTTQRPPAAPWRPARAALGQELPHLPGRFRRAVLRALLVFGGRAIEVHGRERLDDLERPVVFALNHNNAFEAVLAPAALILARHGRGIAFLADWMFFLLPGVGWLLRGAGSIPVYRKRARWGLFERRRRARHRRHEPLAAAAGKLALGLDVGIFPEGRRNGAVDRLLRARAGVGQLAVRAGVAVVPVGISFPAAAALGRMPRVGRMVLRIGEPLWPAPAPPREGPRGAARRARELTRRTMDALAGLSGKRPSGASTLDASPTEEPLVISIAPTTASPAASPRLACSVVRTPEERRDALRVVEAVYLGEKRWIDRAAPEIPLDVAQRSDQTWIVARLDGAAVGVIRLGWNPPLELPAELDVRLEPGVDLGALRAAGSFVEIGRFMVLPEARQGMRVPLALMRAAVLEAVDRGATHLLTEVFAGDPHSPLAFHTRVLGFERLGTHRFGELRCDLVRVILVLDLAAACARLRARGNRAFRLLAEGLEERLAGVARRRIA